MHSIKYNVHWPNIVSLISFSIYDYLNEKQVDTSDDAYDFKRYLIISLIKWIKPSS